MGFVFFGLVLVFAVAALGFSVGDCYFLFGRNACKRLAENIKNEANTDDASYGRLGQWLQTPFAPISDFLADKLAVAAFRELVNKGDGDAKKILDHFTDNERESIGILDYSAGELEDIQQEFPE
jgi:hypothetical protein